jgi:phenylalanyl-tRNA synthetase beta subunit
MRTSLLPEILEISVGNLNKGNEEGKLFELGNTFQTSVIADAEDGTTPNSVIARSAITTQDGVIAGSAITTQDGVIAGSAITTQDGVIAGSAITTQDGIIAGSSITTQDGVIAVSSITTQDGVIAGSTRNPVPNGKPNEKMSLSISTFGKDTDFYLIKGVIEELLTRLGYVSITFESTEDIPSYHPGRCASVKALGRNAEDEILLGYFGELHPDVKANYGIDAPIYAGEIDLDALCNNAELMREYFPLGRFPASTIDLAFVADEDVQVGDIEKSIASINSDLLTALSLFDVYRGKQLGEGKKSLAFNLTFRAEDRTLTDEEVNSLVTKIIAAVGEATGATLREV